MHNALWARTVPGRRARNSISSVIQHDRDRGELRPARVWERLSREPTRCCGKSRTVDAEACNEAQHLSQAQVQFQCEILGELLVGQSPCGVTPWPIPSMRGSSHCAGEGCFVGREAAWSRMQTKRTTLPPESVRESRYCAGEPYFSAHHSVARCAASRYSASLFAKNATAVPGLGSAAPAFAATTADPARVATMRTSVRITGNETSLAHLGSR